MHRDALENAPENFERWRSMPQLSLLTTLLVSQQEMTPKRIGQLGQNIKPILARPPAREGHSLDILKFERKQIWADKSLSAKLRKRKMENLD